MPFADPKPVSYPDKKITDLRAKMMGQTSVTLTVAELTKLLNFVERANRHGVCTLSACCREG
jgi:hypothetical protein